MRQVALRRESLADQAAAAILQMIIDGGKVPGDYLPSTGELAERFGVSRTVIREALADLAGRGLVARSQGRESVVASPGARQLHELLTFHVHRQSMPVTALVEFRRCVEVECAGLAAARATAEQHQRLRRAIDSAADPAAAGSPVEQEHAFHRQVAVASHNPLFVLLLDAVGELLATIGMTPAQRLGCGGHSVEQIRSEHSAILTAIERGAVADASAAMRSHLAGGDAGTTPIS